MIKESRNKDLENLTTFKNICSRIEIDSRHNELCKNSPRLDIKISGKEQIGCSVSAGLSGYKNYERTKEREFSQVTKQSFAQEKQYEQDLSEVEGSDNLVGKKKTYKAQEKSKYMKKSTKLQRIMHY